MNESVQPQNTEQAREQRKQKSYLLSFVNFNKSIWSKFSRSQKIYYVGFWLGIFTFLGYLSKANPSFQIWSLLTVSVVLCGVLSDLLFIYNKIWNTKIGKGLILVAYALLVNFTYAASSQAISKVIGFNSESMVYTLNFVSILSIPFTVIEISFIVFSRLVVYTPALAMILITILTLVHLIAPKLTETITYNKALGNYFITFIFVRLAAYSMTFGVTTGINSTILPMYDIYATKITKDFIYKFEAKEQTRCKLEKGQKAIEVNEKEIIVVNTINDELTFKPQLCKQRLLSK